MSREASTWRGVGEESEKRGEFLSKFFYGAHGRSSIDCFSRAFLPSLSRAAFSLCRSGRDHIFFFSLTLNIALKSTAPRRVRQEPDEPPELSATTIVFCVDKKTKEEEKQKWFFFRPLFFLFHVCKKVIFSLSIPSPLSSLLSPNGRARSILRLSLSLPGVIVRGRRRGRILVRRRRSRRRRSRPSTAAAARKLCSAAPRRAPSRDDQPRVDLVAGEVLDDLNLVLIVAVAGFLRLFFRRRGGSGSLLFIAHFVVAVAVVLVVAVVVRVLFLFFFIFGDRGRGVEEEERGKRERAIEKAKEGKKELTSRTTPQVFSSPFLLVFLKLTTSASSSSSSSSSSPSSFVAALALEGPVAGALPLSAAVGFERAAAAGAGAAGAATAAGASAFFTAGASSFFSGAGAAAAAAGAVCCLCREHHRWERERKRESERARERETEGH